MEISYGSLIIAAQWVPENKKDEDRRETNLSLVARVSSRRVDFAVRDTVRQSRRVGAAP